MADPLAEVRRIGLMPTPPYIKERLDDRERYQTVYAREEGSAAAPTAGLHFTPELLSAVRERGVGIAFVTLHVGLDTFRPVRVDNPAEHPIHREWYRIDDACARAINEAPPGNARDQTLSVARDEGERIGTLRRPGGRLSAEATLDAAE